MKYYTVAVFTDKNGNKVGREFTTYRRVKNALNFILNEWNSLNYYYPIGINSDKKAVSVTVSVIADPSISVTAELPDVLRPWLLNFYQHDMNHFNGKEWAAETWKLYYDGDIADYIPA